MNDRTKKEDFDEPIRINIDSMFLGIEDKVEEMVRVMIQERPPHSEVVEKYLLPIMPQISRTLARDLPVSVIYTIMLECMMNECREIEKERDAAKLPKVNPSAN